MFLKIYFKNTCMFFKIYFKNYIIYRRKFQADNTQKGFSKWLAFAHRREVMEIVAVS